jgi:hypothetical protein
MSQENEKGHLRPPWLGQTATGQWVSLLQTSCMANPLTWLAVKQNVSTRS